MSTYNIVEEYGFLNISSKRHVNNLIEKIVLNNDKTIVLNLEGCQTDYPHTPRLVDYFLYALAKEIGRKKLTIKFNGLGTKEIYILYDIILEGEFFKINEKIEDEKETGKWREIINAILKQSNIILEIIYTTDNTIYEYGK